MLSSARMPFYSLLALCLGFVSGGVYAAPDVYVTDWALGKILRVDFDNHTSQVVNSDTRSDLYGLVVLDDGFAGMNAVVTEPAHGSVWFYPTTPLGTVTGQLISSSGPAAPDGLSSSPTGDLYLIDRSVRSQPVNGSVWRMRRDCPSCPGGFSGSPQLVDGTIPAQQLADTRVVPYNNNSALLTYDLLVLARRPARVFRYPGSVAPRDPSPFIGQGGNGFPPGVEPTGFAVSPDGGLLVATLGGSVLRFSAAGQRVLPDFASGLGSGEKRISVAVEGGENRAFVTSFSAGKAFRFRIEAGGTGTLLNTHTNGVQRPGGIGATTSASGSTPVGTQVRVTPVASATLQFEEVTLAGLTGVRVFLFADPAPGQDRHLSDVPGLLAATGLPDRLIPSYIRAFDLDGVPTFALHVIDTTAQFVDTIQFEIDEEVLGFATSCSTLTSNPAPKQPRLFHATDASDAPVVEGDRFADVSTGCGSSIGRGPDTSAFLSGWDSRATHGIARSKIGALDGAQNLANPAQGGLASFLDPGLLQILNQKLAVVWFAHQAHDTPTALAGLDDYIAAVEAGKMASQIDDSSRNVSGELVARAESAYYMVCGAVVPACERRLP